LHVGAAGSAKEISVRLVHAVIGESMNSAAGALSEGLVKCYTLREQKAAEESERSLVVSF
jgi:hypothetical protein